MADLPEIVINSVKYSLTSMLDSELFELANNGKCRRCLRVSLLTMFSRDMEMKVRKKLREQLQIKLYSSAGRSIKCAADVPHHKVFEEGIGHLQALDIRVCLVRYLPVLPSCCRKTGISILKNTETSYFI